MVVKWYIYIYTPMNKKMMTKLQKIVSWEYKCSVISIICKKEPLHSQFTKRKHKNVWHRSGPIQISVKYIGASNEYFRLGEISWRYLVIGTKNKNLAERSRIRVLLVMISRIAALKKCALLVFNLNVVWQGICFFINYFHSTCLPLPWIPVFHKYQETMEVLVMA